MSEPKPMPSYWILVEEVTHLYGQVDKLKDENAKLQEACERMFKANVDKNGDILRLTREASELRELCADMWHDLQKQLMPPWSEEYEQRMRELGIEVN